jgi:hypothetical protein
MCGSVPTARHGLLRHRNGRGRCARRAERRRPRRFARTHRPVIQPSEVNFARLRRPQPIVADAKGSCSPSRIQMPITKSAPTTNRSNSLQREASQGRRSEPSGSTERQGVTNAKSGPRRCRQRRRRHQRPRQRWPCLAIATPSKTFFRFSPSNFARPRDLDKVTAQRLHAGLMLLRAGCP